MREQKEFSDMFVNALVKCCLLAQLVERSMKAKEEFIYP